MKNIYLFLIVLISLNSQAQLGFEEHLLNSNLNSLTHPKAILVDVDNDGTLDVLSSDSRSIKWFKNNDGLGNFENAHVISSGHTNINSYNVKDIDGDGYVDIVLISSDVIVWYKNDGQGNFGNAQTIVNVDRPRYLSLADIDGDGHLDILVVLGINERVSWYKNDGQGNFGMEQIITSVNTNNVHYLTAADIDGDGDLDIFYLNANSDSMVWYKNLDGLGNFSTVNNIQTIGAPRDISLVDLDGDGHLDILVSESSSLLNHYRVAWYRNINGQGSFSTQQTLFMFSNSNYSQIKSLSAFDISGNGNLDLVIEIADSIETKIFWHENLGGQNNFGIEQIISIEIESSAPDEFHFDFGDVNGDGDKDLLWSSEHNINWFESLNGQGSFDEKKIINKHLGSPFDSSISDIDNDGDLDVIASIGNKIVVYENTGGNGNLEIKQIIKTTLNTILYTADVDKDGYVDLIVGKKNGNGHKIAWFKNDGQGNFGNEQIINEDGSMSAGYINSVYVVDINGNGNLDILLTFSSPNKISWFENLDGFGNFGPEQIITTVNSSISIYPADINGNGSIDIIAALPSAGSFGRVWYENDGLGNFGPQILIDGGKSSSVFAVDIDGNGFTDVLFADDYSGTDADAIVLYKNSDGLGNFNPKQIITNDVIDPTYVYAVDLNNDGHIDIISLSSGKIAWYENLGSQGSFSPQQIISGSLSYPHKIVSGDINGNGNNDLVSLSKYIFEQQLTFHENLGVLGNQIFGTIRYDSNVNGCDPNDLPMGNVMVVADNGTNSFSTFTQANGDYYIQTNEGNFVTTISSEFPTYFDSSPVSHNSNFIGLGNTAISDFCVTVNQTVNDLNITVYPLNDARPGFDASYQIVYNNSGATTLNGDIILTYDDSKINFFSASQTVNSQTSNSLTFNYTTLHPFETRTIDLLFNVEAPPITDINDILAFEAIINPVTGDETEDDNSYVLEQTVIGSYDPNDIRVLEGDEIYFDEVDNYLHYIIRFQNTGTADAINVVVENELDVNLDWSTLQVQNISHDNRVEIKDGYMVKFIFDNIHLPDSTSNETASHGHIAYKIKPKNNVQVGDVITGDAAIYFDFNAPIITNTVETVIVETLGVAENTKSENQVLLYPNPAQDILYVHRANGVHIEELHIYDLQGRVVHKLLGEVDTIQVGHLAAGTYFVEIKSNGSTFVKRIVKM